MRIAHAPGEDEKESRGIHGGPGGAIFKALFEQGDFQTPWFFVHSAYILPGGGIGHHRHDNCEEIFVTVDNASQFTHNGRTAEITGGAAVPLRRGESHAIYNHTDQKTRFYNFNVVMQGLDADGFDFGETRVDVPLESMDRLPIGRFDRSVLQYKRLHGGKGQAGRREIWGPHDFQTNFRLLVHCLLPAGTSIGQHRHKTMEECYIVMNGSGRITAGNETEEVHAGDAVLHPPEEPHGIYNHTQADLELFVVGVSTEKGQFDQEDLDDDLSRR